MKKAIQFLLLSMMITAFVHARTGFHLSVVKENGKGKRRGEFIPANALRSRKNVDRNDPGAGGHLTLVITDVMTIEGDNDSMEKLLSLPGNFVYSFENAESLDSMPYVSLVKDSSTQMNFLERVKRIHKREWEVYRMMVTDKHTGECVCMYLRFQHDLLTINLPDKSNRETMQLKSISPAIPVIHLGSIDYSRYQVGPGISFNVGLMPRRPYLRLLSDIVGPVSLEWMFKPIDNLHDALAIQSAAVGLFFNSCYGILHWGIACYTLTYSRAEAYIGINFAPAMQLFSGRKTWRYRW